MGADACGLLAGGGGQRFVLLQLFAPAQDQRERGADIMADARDPISAGGVPPGDDLVAAAQLFAGLVQFFGQFPGKAGGGQLHGTALGQRVQPVGHSLQVPRAAPAEP